MRLIDYLFNQVKGYKKGITKLEQLSKEGKFDYPAVNSLAGTLEIELIIDQIPKHNGEYNPEEFKELKEEFNIYKIKAEELFKSNRNEYIQSLLRILNNILIEYEYDVEHLFDLEGEELLSTIMGRSVIEENIQFLTDKVDLTNQRKKLEEIDDILKKKSKQLDITSFAAKEIVELYPDDYWWWHLDKIVEEKK